MRHWLFAALLTVPAAAPAQALPPYPDNSPVAAQWIHMGIPPGTAWQAADYQVLTHLLDELLPLDKTTLPRAHSPYSSPLFDQLATPSLPGPEADFQARLLAYERRKALPQRFLLYYYEPNRTTQRFGAEVLRLHLADWATRQYGHGLLRNAPKNLQSPQLLDYQRKEQTAYVLAVEALLYLYEVEHAQYAPTDLHDAAQRFYYLASALPAGPLRTATAARLQALSKNFPHVPTRSALQACYRACR